MARKSLKIEIDVPKDGGGFETRTVEALPLTLDAVLELMEEKPKNEDGSAVMIPVIGRDGKPTDEKREASYMDLAPWGSMAVLTSPHALESAQRIVRNALRRHPEIAESDQLGAILDLGVTAEICAFALTAANLQKAAKESGKGEAESA